MRARTSSGSRCSEAAVKPTRSQKRTETIFRSSRADGGCSASGAVQKPQNTKPSGFSFPQFEQVSTRSSVGPGPPRDKRSSAVLVLVSPDAPHREAAGPEDEQEGDGVEAARTTQEVDGERGDREEERDPSEQEQRRERRLQRKRDDDHRDCRDDQKAPQRRMVGEEAPHDAVM